MCHELTRKGVEVLFDDRLGTSAGEKFNDAQLLGIPLKVVVSDRTKEDEVEILSGLNNKEKLVDIKDLVNIVTRQAQSVL
jgi:prolyl-tRNA synthetase